MGDRWVLQHSTSALFRGCVEGNNIFTVLCNQILVNTCHAKLQQISVCSMCSVCVYVCVSGENITM